MPFSIRGSAVSLSSLLRLRVLQAVLATIYVILICYSSVHRGWWLNLRRPLAFGGMATLLTYLIVPIYFSGVCYRLRLTLPPFLFLILRVSFELFVLIFWCATFITMLLPKGKDFRHLFTKPPYTEWYVAVVMAGFESVSFIWSMVLVVREI
ncbi:hypothetical protein BDR22DRAFT_869327 [Usnea florida]